jgi:hypothetical protein
MRSARGRSRSRSLSPVNETQRSEEDLPQQADSDIPRPPPQLSPLQRLADHLECTKVEAAHLVPEVRMKIAEQQLTLTISEIGRLEIEARRVLVASGPTDPVQALTDQLSAQEQRQLEPWRKRLQQLTVRKNRYMAMDASDLKKRAVDMAKDACLSPTELLILWTALYADEDERKLMAALVVAETDPDKIPLFNYNIATKKGEVFLAQYGADLAHFGLPLFPEDREYDLQNQKLLRTGDPGGAGKANRPAVFRDNRGDEDLLGAGSTLPLVQNPETNQWEADATLVQKAFDDAFALIRSLSAKVDAIQGTAKAASNAPEKTPLEKQLSSLTGAVRELRRAMSSAQATALRPSGRRSYRSRPPRGGETEEDF